jgi:hypothetical protein
VVHYFPAAAFAALTRLAMRQDAVADVPSREALPEILENAKPMHASLGDFIAVLRAKGELKQVDAPVDPYLEITEIADRCVKELGGGPALLFTNVKGSRFPLLINAVATKRRMELALGVESLDDLGGRSPRVLATSSAS